MQGRFKLPKQVLLTEAIFSSANQNNLKWTNEIIIKKKNQNILLSCTKVSTVWSEYNLSVLQNLKVQLKWCGDSAVQFVFQLIITCMQWKPIVFTLTLNGLQHFQQLQFLYDLPLCVPIQWVTDLGKDMWEYSASLEAVKVSKEIFQHTPTGPPYSFFQTPLLA